MADSYSRIQTGYEFPPQTFAVDAAGVSVFLEAVEDTSYPYREKGLVPPMAVAALAFSTLSETVSLPPGSIHVSQELGFSRPARQNESLTSHARVGRVQKRGRLHLVAVDIDVRNEATETVLTARTSFVLPQPEDEA